MADLSRDMVDPSPLVAARDRSRTPTGSLAPSDAKAGSLTTIAPLRSHSRGDNPAYSNISLKVYWTFPTYVHCSSMQGEATFQPRDIVYDMNAPVAGPPPKAGVPKAGDEADPPHPAGVRASWPKPPPKAAPADANAGPPTIG